MKMVLSQVFLYGVLGPPIGQVVFFLLSFSHSAFADTGHHAARLVEVPFLVIATLLAFPFSYYFGGVTAVLVGLIVGVAKKYDNHTIFVPAIAALAVWASISFFSGQFDAKNWETFFPEQGWTIHPLVMLTIQLIAALIVWWLARRFEVRSGRRKSEVLHAKH
jgi:hypothetical protein